MLVEAEQAVRQAIEYAESLYGDLEHLDALTAQVVADYKRVSTSCHEADAKSTALAGTVETIEQRLNALHEIGSAADEGRAAVEQLADEVAHAATSFESQRNALEARAVEAVRITGQLTELERRAARLLETDQPFAVAASNVDRLELRAAQAAELTAALERRIDSLRGEATRLTQGLDAIRGPVTPIESGAQNAAKRKRQLVPRLLNTRSTDVRLSAPWPLIAGTAAAMVLVLGSLPLVQRNESPVPLAQGDERQLIAAAFAPPVALATSGTNEPSVASADPAPPAPTPVPERPPMPPKAPAKAKAAPVRSTTPPAVNNRELPAFIGALNIGSMPEGADVFVNHQYVGQTPLSLADVPAGSQVVRIEHEGYRRWTASVRVAAKKREQVNAKLEPIAAQ